MIRADDNPSKRKVSAACTMPLGLGFMTFRPAKDYLSGERVQCLCCGRWLASVGNHVVRVHKITMAEYREQFGIPATWPLDAAGVTEARVASISEEQRRQKRELMNVLRAGRVPRVKQWYSPVTRDMRKMQAAGARAEQKARRDVQGT